MRRAGVFLQLPPALVATGGMLPGPITLVGENGEEWDSCMVISSRSGKRGIDYRLHKQLRAVVTSLQLAAGQTICSMGAASDALFICRAGSCSEYRVSGGRPRVRGPS